MSILQRNRVASLSHLLSPTLGGGSRTRARRVSASFTASSLASLPSCPTLSVVGSSEQEPDTSKRGRVTSAPYVRRKGDSTATVHSEAHGHYHHLQSGKFAPLQAAVFSKPFTATTGPQKPATQDILSSLGDVSELPPATHEVNKGMPKAPQLAFRSPASQPRLLPLQSGFYKPVPMANTAPKISYELSGLVNAPLVRSPSQAVFDSILDPHRRSPAPENRPALRLLSTEEEHVFSVHLPGFALEMVQVSAQKGNKLKVVADRWHAEFNCHHEWTIEFDSRDANSQRTRAGFEDDNTLVIRVKRYNGNASCMRSRLR